MEHTSFIMPLPEEIEKLKKKHGELNLVELILEGVEYKAIVRKVYKNTIKGLDSESNGFYRAVWNRVKLVYDNEFETNDILIVEALTKLTD